MEQKEKKPLSKQQIAFRKRRMKGYRAYIRRKHAEMRKREEQKKKEKERERKRREREREKAKHKRKPGRPKKRGPKPNYSKRQRERIAKQKKQKISRKLPPFTYQIISCTNGKQKTIIGKYRSISDAYAEFNALKLKDNNVIFPAEYTGSDKIVNYVSEYLLIEKSDAENSVLRNEYGKLVEQVLNKEGWIVVDKFRYKKEETFWLYGFDNKTDRKTFMWIYENVLPYGLGGKYDFKRILTYKNKVVLKLDDGDIDLIICKTDADAARFYNLIQEYSNKDKIKNLLFLGDYSYLSEKRMKLEKELMDLTGWSEKKIRMKSTSFRIK